MIAEAFLVTLAGPGPYPWVCQDNGLPLPGAPAESGEGGNAGPRLP
jgi:hypothetical protein